MSTWSCSSCGLVNSIKQNQCKACFTSNTANGGGDDAKVNEEEKTLTRVQHTMVNTLSRNIVLSFGKNNALQTGHMTNKNVFQPQILFLDNLTNVISIAAGFDHSGVVDISGNVTLWGDNKYNQISSTNRAPYVKPHSLSLSANIRQIALASNASLFLDDRGKVWGIGNGTTRKNDKNVCLINFPFAKSSGECVENICCGYQHFGAISNYNNLYVWGNNTKGQCGLGNDGYRFVSKPTLVYFKSKIAKCAMGRWHTLALTKQGHMYSCGWGRFGVLGLNDFDGRNSFEYVAVRNAKNNKTLLVSDIKCGAVHNCCIVKGHRCYVWGRGKFGRLGLGNEQNVLTPTLLNIKFVQKNDGINKISLGGDNGCVISLFGDIYVWGKSLEGQLGFYNKDNNVCSPKRLVLGENLRHKCEPTNVVLGDCHSIMLMKPSSPFQAARIFNSKV
eukprot:625933_1